MHLQDWQEQILEREGFNKPPNKGLFYFRYILFFRVY